MGTSFSELTCVVTHGIVVESEIRVMVFKRKILELEPSVEVGYPLVHSLPLHLAESAVTTFNKLLTILVFLTVRNFRLLALTFLIVVLKSVVHLALIKVRHE